MDYLGCKSPKIAKRWGSALRPSCFRRLRPHTPCRFHD